jgi:hypothetical protein
MAKGSKKKGFCPRCRQSMKLRNRYCESCGAANPMLFPQPVRRRPAAKAAGPGYAPVVSLRTGVPGWDPRWTDILSNPDPDARDRLFKTHFPDYTGGGAA